MDKRKTPPTIDNTLFKRQRPEDSSPFDIANIYTIDTNNPWPPLQMNLPQPTIPTNAAITTTADTKNFYGQTAEVYTCRFSPSGNHIASAGADKDLWNTHGDGNDCGIIRGHIGSINELHWSGDASSLFTASADKTCGMFDAQTGERIKCYKGHMSAVNSCSVSRTIGHDILISGSDDGCVKIWDSRTRDAVKSIESVSSVTSVCFSKSNDLIFAGSRDSTIVAWEIRMKRALFSLTGHLNSIAGICLSPDRTQLLSSALDNTLRIWDVNSYTLDNIRLQTILQGTVAAPHGLEPQLSPPAWSSDGSMVGVGTCNGEVAIWHRRTHDSLATRFEHISSINGVDFHPTEPIVVSCSSDKRLIIDRIDLR